MPVSSTATATPLEPSSPADHAASAWIARRFHWRAYSAAAVGGGFDAASTLLLWARLASETTMSAARAPMVRDRALRGMATSFVWTTSPRARSPPSLESGTHRSRREKPQMFRYLAGLSSGR